MTTKIIQYFIAKNSVETFSQIRKYLKSETLMFLDNEIATLTPPFGKK